MGLWWQRRWWLMGWWGRKETWVDDCGVGVENTARTGLGEIHKGSKINSIKTYTILYKEKHVS